MAPLYPAVIQAAADGYRVFFPDMPGCASGGATAQEAARNAEAALQASLDAVEARGDPLPKPTAAPADRDSHVARLLVRAEAVPVRDLQAFLASWEHRPDARRGALAWTLRSARAELAARLRGSAGKLNA
jgi:predicted RNase H-like HicB family nuclease